MPEHLKPLAIFLPGLYDGGAERTVLNLAAGLAERGHPIDLVLAQAEGPFLSEVPSLTRLVVLNARPRRALRTVSSLPAFVQYLRSARPAAVLAELESNLVALWASRFAGYPVRVVICEQNTFSLENGRFPAWYSALQLQLVRRFYPWAADIVAVSGGVADDLAVTANIPRERIRVIYSPIVTSDLMEKARAPLEHPWFKPGEPPVLLAVGRLSVQKDYPTLIHAFARVHRVKKVRLLILGEGEDRSSLEGMVRGLGLEEDVGFPGFVPNPYPYMAHSSLFILSSKWEGLPTVLVEALSCGVRVLATDCPSGPREILAAGEHGQLVPVGDVDAIARAIEAVIDGKVAHPSRESWHRFEMETVLDEYLDVLLGGNRSSGTVAHDRAPVIRDDDHSQRLEVYG